VTRSELDNDCAVDLRLTKVYELFQTSSAFGGRRILLYPCHERWMAGWNAKVGRTDWSLSARLARTTGLRPKRSNAGNIGNPTFKKRSMRFNGSPPISYPYYPCSLHPIFARRWMIYSDWCPESPRERLWILCLDVQTVLPTPRRIHCLSHRGD
jgi:hypothetical protein